jgi:HlyD family secretion protein
MSRAKRGAAGVMVVLLAGGGIWWATRGDAPDGSIAASGTVEATEADLGFPAGGRLAEVRVHEGDAVRAGDVLARLDLAEATARRAAAEAQVMTARAVLAEMEHGARPEEVGQARAAADAARERAEESRRLLERAERLFAGGAVSRESLDQARTAHEVARSGATQAREQLALVERGVRRERLDAQRGVVQAAEAALAQAEAALANGEIVAPFDGIVSLRHRQAGETVGPGLPVITMMDPLDRWVRIFVRADRIGGVGIGQEAEIATDSHRDRRYAGRVTFISHQAEFTPRNVQTDADRVKLVYAVKVSVRSDPEVELRPGVAADVRLRPRGADAGS